MIPFTLNNHGKLHSVERPAVMGIINITADSFYEGSRHESVKDVLQTAEKHLHDGAFMLDLGAVSTRPGAALSNEEDELKRLLPALDAVVKEYPEALVSVDTFRSSVAKISYEHGAGMINDISGGSMDPQMFDIILKLKVTYVMMHMQGTPENMQTNPTYDSVVREVIFSLSDRAEKLRHAGHPDIILDPGFGFGKTTEHNFELLKNLDIFSMLGYPMLVGLSRKSMIWRTLKITPEQALNGSTALHTVALLKGASILRVHDVKEAMEVVTLCELLGY
ncbi:MAG: dihydropteroate synthase [Bacteroidota bacterium]